MSFEKKQKVIFILCLIFGLWHFATQWTTTLLSFLQWDTEEVMTITDLGYIQAFGSLCNAVGALAAGQLADTIGAQTMFMISAIFTAVYYSGISMARSWYSFFFLQIFRVGYQLDGTAEMYLATVTTESERTGALMRLTIPQAMAMFFGPIVGSKVAAWTSLRTSQFIVGIVLFVTLMPVLTFFLPTTHSIPRLASARLRPQDYWHMISKNSSLKEGLLIRALLISAYVCYEMISRNFLLRNYMHNTNDSAYVLLTMSAALLIVQFVVLPIVQRRTNPKRLLQFSLIGLFVSYVSAVFATSFEQMLVITAVQTGAYAIAYAESSTQITSAVELTDLGKATGLASMVQWLTHFILPIYASQLVEVHCDLVQSRSSSNQTCFQHLHYTYAFYTSALLSIILFAYVTIHGKTNSNRSGALLPSLSATTY